MNTIFSKIAGVTFNGRQSSVKNLSVGDLLTLVREPNNRHDEDAIKVTTTRGIELGYIRAKLAAELAPLMDTGARFACKVLEVTGGRDQDRNFGCNILITRDDAKC